MKLTFPPSHDLEDLRPLYEKFRRYNPNLYNTWFKRVIEINTSRYDHAKSDESDSIVLRNNRKIKDFLLAEVECQSADALTSALADFQKLMWGDVKQYLIDKEGQR